MPVQGSSDPSIVLLVGGAKAQVIPGLLPFPQYMKLDSGASARMLVGGAKFDS